jgi:hypothetical protein
MTRLEKIYQTQLKKKIIYKSLLLKCFERIWQKRLARSRTRQT